MVDGLREWVEGIQCGLGKLKGCRRRREQHLLPFNGGRLECFAVPGICRRNGGPFPLFVVQSFSELAATAARISGTRSLLTEVGGDVGSLRVERGNKKVFAEGSGQYSYYQRYGENGSHTGKGNDGFSFYNTRIGKKCREQIKKGPRWPGAVCLPTAQPTNTV
jgi:hypothetical protein